MVINTRTNLWRDTKSGANGGIYDLACELTGNSNKSELYRCIAGEMNAFQKRKTPKPEGKPKPDRVQLTEALAYAIHNNTVSKRNTMLKEHLNKNE